MKKTIALILGMLMLLTLAACGGTTPATDNTTGNTEATEATETAEESSVLKVGMECNYAPYNWSQADDSNGAVPIKNVDGMYTNGYDVQVALQIAEALGKEIEIYAYEWDSLVPAVQSGNLDMIIAGMSPTDERKEKIDFSDIYYNSNLVIVTKGDALADVVTIADLDGKKIAAQSGTSHFDALSTQTTAEVQELSDFSTMQMALSAGTIDGYVAEEPTAMAFCGEGSEYTYVPLVNNETGFTVPIEDTSIAVGVQKGSELTASINAYLAGFDTDAQRELMDQMVSIAPVEE